MTDLLIAAAALAVITLGAELLVRGATRLALRAGVSSLFVGLTVVGFGTSTPELGASVTATLEGASAASVGNVVGSNLFNTGAILGLTALLKPIRVRLAALRLQLWIAVAASLAVFAAAPLGGLPRWLGAVLLGALAAYLVASYRSARRAAADDEALAAREVASTLAAGAERPRGGGTARDALLVLLGLGLLIAGSRFFVGSALTLARGLGASDLVIGLTLVSVGTSLPELVTSVVAARRGNPDVAVGNVIGSTVFNLLGILGVAALVGRQEVPRGVLLVDAPLMAAATLALLPMVRTGGRISRVEGALLVLGYAAYAATLALR